MLFAKFWIGQSLPPMYISYCPPFVSVRRIAHVSLQGKSRGTYTTSDECDDAVYVIRMIGSCTCVVSPFI